MQISAGIQNYTASIRSAMQTVILQKAVSQDASSMSAVLKGISKVTGVGGNIDISV